MAATFGPGRPARAREGSEAHWGPMPSETLIRWLPICDDGANHQATEVASALDATTTLSISAP